MSNPVRAADVARALEQRIRKNEFEPHERLPSIAALAEEYAIAQNTAHTAIKILARKGLVTSVRSYGTVVRDWRRPRQVRRSRAVYRDDRGFFFDQAAQDWVPATPASRIAWEPAGDYIAELLGIEPGSEVLIRERVTGDEVELAPGRRHITPQQVCSTTVPADIAREHNLGRPNTGAGGVLCRLEEAYGPLTFRDVAYARFPSEQEIDLLQLGGVDTPILGIAVVATASDGRVVVVNDVRMDGRRWMVEHPLKRSASASTKASES
jgi:DNA-binding GntR family transcriptional regulator